MPSPGWRSVVHGLQHCCQWLLCPAARHVGHQTTPGVSCLLAAALASQDSCCWLVRLTACHTHTRNTERAQIHQHPLHAATAQVDGDSVQSQKVLTRLCCSLEACCKMPQQKASCLAGCYRGHPATVLTCCLQLLKASMLTAGPSTPIKQYDWSRCQPLVQPFVITRVCLHAYNTTEHAHT